MRHLRRKHGKPRLRALRRVETPPGVQAQHDWFEVRVPLGARERRIQALIGTLSRSRAKFCWVSEDQSQLAWHTGHLELFGRYGSVPLWVRIDNLKTSVARGAGPTVVLNRSYEVFARTCGFEIDPCRSATGSDKGKAERGVRTFRSAFGEVFRRGAGWVCQIFCVNGPRTHTGTRPSNTIDRWFSAPVPVLNGPGPALRRPLDREI